MSLSKTYQKLLKNHFMAVQAVQTGLLMGAGDIIAQSAVEKRSLKEYEPVRTAKFASLGVVFVGPAITMWYKVLAKQFGTVSSPVVTIKKVASDQLLFAPGFLAIIVSSVHLLNGKTPSEIRRELSATYPDILITNWKIWPAVQVVNFYFMPLKYQVLLAQVVALFWNTYLSWKTQSASQKY